MSVEMSELNHIIARCSEIIDDPYRKLAGKKWPGPGYFGYSCVFAPEEILHAAGFIPIRLFAHYKGRRFTEKFLPAQTCGFARNLLETFRDQQLDFMAGCIFTHCCDVLWGCFRAVKKFWPKTVYHINTPYKGNHTHNRDFLVHELEKFKQDLEQTYHLKITDRDLERSIAIYRENHRLLTGLRRFLKEGHMSGTDYFIVQKAGYFIPKETHNEILLELNHFLENTGSKGKQQQGKKSLKLLVSGFLNGEIEYIKYIEDLGADVAADDLCGFSRYLVPAGSGPYERCFENPLQEISCNCLSRFCPMGVKNKEWYSLLKEKYRESGSQAIIFFIYPFCDQQAIEYVLLKHQLEKEGIKTLFLQPSVNARVSGQIETRLEAFLEMLREKPEY
ncbi:MAG: 2-hydroxyacyl-CoA dehydratase family protein [Candidatus Aminicenantes bacterium]|jgi:benzoyl-CoA reductase/2-hydroxyglutaryl-CoA dehydratase subunit BcrC/BadD/HgdB